MKSNKDFQYAKNYYNNNSILDKLWAKSWLYFAWTIEIIAIIIYIKMICFYLSFISKGLVTGEISSLGYKCSMAVFESMELLATQFIDWIKSLFT